MASICGVNLRAAFGPGGTYQHTLGVYKRPWQRSIFAELNLRIPVAQKALFTEFWLIGVCLVGLVVTLWSSQQFRIAGPDSNTAAILAVSLASIGLDTRAKGGSESAVIGTVLMALSATLLASGVVAYALGRLREGG